MGIRKLLTVVATAALIAGGMTLASAPAASAIPANPILSVGPGSTDGSLLVTYTPGMGWIGITPSNLGVTTCNHHDWDTASGGPGSGMGWINVDGSGTIEFSVMTEWYNVQPDVTLTPGGSYGVCDDDSPYAPVYGNAAGGLAAAEDIPIPPWVQGYGRAAAVDPCLEGWTGSWEQWPHNGNGGWVCTRSIPSLG